jgi:hypothetical protein
MIVIAGTGSNAARKPRAPARHDSLCLIEAPTPAKWRGCFRTQGGCHRAATSVKFGCLGCLLHASLLLAFLLFFPFLCGFQNVSIGRHVDGHLRALRIGAFQLISLLPLHLH